MFKYQPLLLQVAVCVGAQNHQVAEDGPHLDDLDLELAALFNSLKLVQLASILIDDLLDAGARSFIVEASLAVSQLHQDLLALIHQLLDFQRDGQRDDGEQEKVSQALLPEIEGKSACVEYPAVVLVSHGQCPRNSIAVQVAYICLFIILIGESAEIQALERVSERIEKGYDDGDPAASLLQNDAQNHNHKAGCKDVVGE